MRKRFLRLPSPAMVVALIALFVGLTGSAAAVTVSYALNSDKVDGKHAVGAGATRNHAAGKLVATKPTGAQKGQFAKKFIPDSSIGFASIAAASGTPAVTHFGGNGTSSVTVTDLGTGHYAVSFHGNYPGLATADQVTVLGSISDTDNFNVGSVSMDEGAVSATQIDVVIWVWSTDTTPNPLEDRDVSVLVLR